MYFDFEDRRPDTPRVPSGVSRGAGVLLSIAVHALGVILVFVVPAAFTGQVLAKPVEDRESVRFVQMTPLVDRSVKPRRPAEHSDRDRRSATPVRPLNPENTAPYSRGSTPEKTEAPPPQPADGSDAT